MTDILALDIATTCGWARGPVGGEAPPLCGSVRFAKPGSSQLAICGRALEWAIGAIAPPLPDVVAIEDLLPPGAFRGKSNVDHDLLAALHGVIMGVCFMRGVFEVHKYSVQTIRAHFIDLKSTGKGEQKLAVVRKCKELEWAAKDPDAADACAVWSYQCGLLDRDHGVRISPLFRRVTGSQPRD